MTRINCIPVEDLHNKHLLAEYRELPRIFKLARPCNTAPDRYVLGAGHVKFFYSRLKYLYNRQCDLYIEMIKRGYKPTYNPEGLRQFADIKPKLWNDWQPDADAMRINRERINERLEGMKK